MTKFNITGLKMIKMKNKSPQELDKQNICICLVKMSNQTTLRNVSTKYTGQSSWQPASPKLKKNSLCDRKGRRRDAFKDRKPPVSRCWMLESEDVWWTPAAWNLLLNHKPELFSVVYCPYHGGFYSTVHLYPINPFSCCKCDLFSLIRYESWRLLIHSDVI